MVQADGATLGRAHSLLTALQRSHTAQPKYLMRDLTWRMLMSGWAESHRQHDVVEFTAFFLQRHNITLAQGTWHARRLHDGHIQVRDMGQCTQPITLRIPTVPPGLHPTVQVQSLIDFWSGDPTSECIQALVQQPQTLFLQVDRFEVSAGRVHKRLDKVEANHILAVPVFSTMDLTITVTWYELIAIISHHGPHPQVGHYTAALIQGTQCWQCDDNRTARHQPDVTAVTHSTESYMLLYKLRAS